MPNKNHKIVLYTMIFILLLMFFYRPYTVYGGGQSELNRAGTVYNFMWSDDIDLTVSTDFSMLLIQVLFLIIIAGALLIIFNKKP